MSNEYKEDLRIIRTRNLLCKAFYELLEETPYEKISVIDICNKAMVHRATFYNHFEDKEHLLQFAIDEIQEELFNKAIINEKYSNPKEMYMTLIEQVIDYVEANRQQFLLIIKNNNREKILGLLLSTIERSIKYLTSKNEYKMNYSVPTNILVDFLSGGITNLGLRWLETNYCSKHDLINYFDIFLNEKIYLK